MIYECCNHNSNLLKNHCMCYKVFPTCYTNSMKMHLMDHFIKSYNVFHKLVIMKYDPNNFTKIILIFLI